ncbi:hypothetical protein ACFQL1_15070 [Halomicroarcula sp. GCM10025709]
MTIAKEEMPGVERGRDTDADPLEDRAQTNGHSDRRHPAADEEDDDE